MSRRHGHEVSHDKKALQEEEEEEENRQEDENGAKGLLFVHFCAITVVLFEWLDCETGANRPILEHRGSGKL